MVSSTNVLDSICEKVASDLWSSGGFSLDAPVSATNYKYGAREFRRPSYFEYK